MDVGSITSNNGMFNLDGQQYDIGTLMMVLNQNRLSGIDEQVASRMSNLNDRNNKVKALNELMAKMRSHKAEGRDDDASWGGSDSVDASDKAETFTLSGTDGQQRTPDGWMRYFGMETTDVQYNWDSNQRDSAWDANISTVQSMIDGLNSDSQMEMTQLQSLMNKRNTASDMTTNILATDKKAKDSIVSNLR